MSIFSILFLLFITIPVLEIYLLIKVGSVIGAGYTILLVIATAILGAYLLRKQGLSTFARAQESLKKNEIPAMEMMEGVILLITGALLLTPGFFTDTLGFLCLIPVIRQSMVKKLIGQLIIIQSGSTRHTTTESKTIEGEFWQDEEK